MDWKQARNGTLAMWRDIRGAIGIAHPVDLLTDINVVCDLCEKAREVARGELGICRFCLAYQQFGGCRGASAVMSECVAERDWERLRNLVDDFIANLEGLEIPSGSDAAPAH